MTFLTDKDVVLGRGLGFSSLPGNQRFLDLVKTRKEEYKSTGSHSIKSRIARELYTELTEVIGARFLAIDEESSNDNEGGGESRYKVVTDKNVCLEKIKQALREKSYKKKTKSKGGKRKAAAKVSKESKAFDSHENGNNDDSVPNDSFSDGSILMDDETLPTDFDTMFDVGKDEASGNDDAPISPAPARCSSLSPLPLSMFESHGDVIPDSRLLLFQGHDVGGGGERHEFHVEQDGNGRNRPPILDSDLSQAFLSMLGIGPEVPRFTEADIVMERESLAEEEKVEALSDTFGRMCMINTIHQNKRARRDLDINAVSFLLRQMKYELVRIPVHEKQALLDATTKCAPEEFGDARLEVFLRSEGMNAALAARRFVTYWECRRDLFGPDKYALPMTLSAATRDDLVSLNTGVISLLPFPDSSGRRMLLAIPRRNSRQGYSSESLTRAFWYLIETIVREPGYDGWGFVLVVNSKGASIFDFDIRFDFQMFHFLQHAIPARAVPIHDCCPSSVLLQILKPIYFFRMNKAMRLRIVIHDVPENELLASLFPYGITSEMLPVEMGGTMVLDQYECLMEEIS